MSVFRGSVHLAVGFSFLPAVCDLYLFTISAVAESWEFGDGGSKSPTCKFYFLLANTLSLCYNELSEDEYPDVT